MPATPPVIPRFSQPLIETHCHLDYLDAAGRDDMLAAAADLGVERIITIAVSPENLDTVLTIARTHPTVWCSQGIHPHEAQTLTPDVLDRIRSGLTCERALAVGEIGLDYYYDHADRAVQRAVFEQQLQLAADADLPVIIHSRDADDDTRSILENFATSLGRKGVIHSFTASLALAEFCLDAGFKLGFNGIITFKSADNVRAVLSATPLASIVLETDAPYLTPVPFRGKTNAPIYLPLVAAHIAHVKQCAVEDVLHHCYQNSLALFFPHEVAAAPLLLSGAPA